MNPPFPQYTLIRATWSQSLIGLAISFLHPKHFNQPSHVEFYMPRGTLCFGSSPSTKGVAYLPIKKTWRTYNEKYYVFPVAFGWAYALTQSGKPYDYNGVFWEAFNRDWHDDGEWFCSELIAASLERSDHSYRTKWRDVAVSPKELISHASDVITRNTPDMKQRFEHYGYPVPQHWQT